MMKNKLLQRLRLLIFVGWEFPKPARYSQGDTLRLKTADAQNNVCQ